MIRDKYEQIWLKHITKCDVQCLMISFLIFPGISLLDFLYETGVT